MVLTWYAKKTVFENIYLALCMALNMFFVNYVTVNYVTKNLLAIADH